MEEIKQMNKDIFRENLLKTIEEISKKKRLIFNDCKFVIEPVKEKDKPLNGADDMMRLNILSKENIGNKQLTLDNTVNLLCGLQPLVPIWIDVLFVEMNENAAIFKLRCSLRFRKPTLLRNAETGHAPFKAIIEEIF
ncbi:hypothetical protein [Brevibacillus sp. HB2.2]|uniref:hypothetical protein n=1 Tax=Brevibacillus TaxID=55080 RepID=UPI00156B9949|nr:hypothetical protein [Brevibacillus sp. HB2.2]NRS49263.1 hypothetical protein [Brevibacillus sp. HB2.2]